MVMTGIMRRFGAAQKLLDYSHTAFRTASRERRMSRGKQRGSLWAGLDFLETRLLLSTSGLNGLQLLGNASPQTTADGNIIRLTSATGGQAGGAFSTGQKSVSSFSAQFSFRITDPGGNDRGDGVMFVISSAGIALGPGGGDMGYAGLSPSVGVEFDTHQNYDFRNDPSNNHVGIDVDGNMRSIVTAEAPFNLASGQVWTAWVDYSGNTLTISLANSGVRPSTPLLSYAIDLAAVLGSNTAYLGLTASTGAAWENHDLINWSETQSEPAKVNLAPLELSGNFNYDSNTGRYNSSGPVDIGLSPNGSEAFTPLITVNGQVSYDATTISATGIITSDLGNAGTTLFYGSFAIPIGTAATTSLDIGDDAQSLKIIGSPYAIRSLSLVDPNHGTTADAMIAMNGNLPLPLTLNVASIDLPLVINSQGLLLESHTLEFPDTTFSLFGLKVSASSMSIGYNFAQDKLILQGAFQLPEIHNATADLSGDGNGIEITSKGVTFAGTASVEDIELPGAFSLKHGEITFNSNHSTFGGSTIISFPEGFDLGGNFDLINGQLNAIGVSWSGNEPVGPSGWFLTSASGQLNNLAFSATDSISFTGAMGFSFGPDFGTIQLPGWLGGAKVDPDLLSLNLTATIDDKKLQGDGTLSIVGGLASVDVHALWNFGQGIFTSNGNLSLAGGVFTGTAGVTIGQGVFTLNAHGKAILPMTAMNSLAKLFGATVPDITLVNSNLYLYAKPAGSLTDDYVEIWGTSDLTKQANSFLNLPIGIRVSFSGAITILYQSNLESLSALQSTTVMSVASPATSVLSPAAAGDLAAARDSFLVNAGTPYALLEAQWTNAAPGVVLQVQAPNGKIYTEATLPASMGVIDQMTGSTQRTVGISKPAAGKWTIIVPDTSGLGTVTFSAVGGIAVPSLKLTSPSVATSSQNVSIRFAASHADPLATVSLYYSTSSSGTDGVPIVSGLPASAAGTYQWNTTNIAPGNYYIFGVLNSPAVAPIVSHASGMFVRYQLALVQGPANTTAGVAASPATQINIEDANGAVVVNDNEKVTLAVVSTSGFVLSTTTIAAKNGVAFFPNVTVATAGEYSLRFECGSMASITSGNFTVAPGVTTLTVPKTAATYTFGAGIALATTLKSTTPASVAFTGNATITDASDHVLAISTVVKNGVLKWQLTGLLAESYVCQVNYLGDANHAAATSSTFTLIINPAVTKTTLVASSSTLVFGQPLTLTATVGLTAAPTAARTGTITFYDGTTQIGTPVALTVNSASLTFTPSAVGKHSYKAIYSSDNNFKTSTSSALARTVAKDKTTITLTPSLVSPIPVNHSFNLAVHVAIVAPGVASITGDAVTIKDGSKTLGTVHLDSSGNATLTALNYTSAGTHSFTAIFAGDVDTNPITSTLLKVTIA